MYVKWLHVFYLTAVVDLCKCEISNVYKKENYWNNSNPRALEVKVAEHKKETNTNSVSEIKKP